MITSPLAHEPPGSCMLAATFRTPEAMLLEATEAVVISTKLR
jgi:hypothetical protein